MINPISTYRIQFNKDFTFKDFQTIIPYLHELGVKTIYASPIFKAAAGSTHGYDVTDPNQINPEIGSIEELRTISAKLKSLDMFWVQDIVPNHMGFHHENAWLMDVLKNGENSAYRNYFDLTTADLLKEPLMVPFLGDDLQTVIANGDLRVIDRDGEKLFRYFDSEWPLRTDLVKEKSATHELAQQQYYRLCSHQETNSRINYRRFFTVNSLICLNMQREDVFLDYHRLTSILLEEEVFQGLRVDHVDGLGDPAGYLRRLREMCGPDIYIVVEKILEPGEQLPRTWPVQGTTGYDYLGFVNQLFTNQKAERKFDAFYKDLGGFKRPIYQQVLKKKRAFLDKYMQGELDNLDQLADTLGLRGRIEGFRQLVGELLVRLPVYRFYAISYPLTDEEVKTIKAIFDELEEEGIPGESLPEFRDLILGKGASESKDDPAITFFRRLMQFSGPLMAKGVEDTLMYTFNRFIGNNEVGDSPELFGISAGEFHEQISLRNKYWPLAMNASATHDTKRGEDARARLAVLTDLRAEWLSEVEAWQQMNLKIKTAGAPDANDEYFIYQTLIGSCPESGPDDDDYEQRLLEYIEKALRESKRNSGWDQPNLEYETHTKDFIQYLLDPAGEFWPRFSRFLHKVSGFGKLTSLSALVLKHTLPGVPDTYQGTEVWDLSLVDPDNRRSVDYQLRMKMQPGTPGYEKIRLLRSLLAMRKQSSEIFSNGLYIPLEVSGKFASSVIAYARHYKSEWIIVAVAVNLATVVSSPESWAELDWQDTHIKLPENLDGKAGVFRNVLDNLPVDLTKDDNKGFSEIPLSTLFQQAHFAVLFVSLPEQKRGAGILLPVSSLPSAYGIGDFGPQAEQFISFLASCGMKYWQLLPMNPLTADQAYSPYSATSVMAGNILLISPEQLAESALLSQDDLKGYQRKIKRNISYGKVSAAKKELLSKAYQNFKSWDSGIPIRDFDRFCQAESNWLDDYALFVLVSDLEQGRPWFKWPEKLKKRDAATLKTISRAHAANLEEIRWQQFIFFRQWKQVKAQANLYGIELIGDLPFYTAHNSADVWAHPELFAVDVRGEVTGAAGVPPDYFNAEGQLWGMPVYDWKAMAGNKYKWWSDRVAKNLEIYDQVRLDHFRAFSQYWEVPAGSDSARTGKWKAGPGSAFLKALLTSIGSLPLIAEDLGEISEEVYQLRDEFNLPGMKVLQFAFGDDSAGSTHAPHNFTTTNCIVYTGTHDNNTTRGWYEQETGGQVQKRLDRYIGAKLSGSNAAWQLIRLALSSTADRAIIPMQDLLNKSAKSRMNTPASVVGNWTWRLKNREISAALAEKIRSCLRLYGR